MRGIWTSPLVNILFRVKLHAIKWIPEVKSSFENFYLGTVHLSLPFMLKH